MEKTGGNGIGRIIEATGSTELAGSCFKYLRLVKIKKFYFIQVL